MKQAEVPFDKQVIDDIVKQQEVNPERCSIRELKRLVDKIEEKLGVRFIRMEFGIPGFKTNSTAIEAEKEALSKKEISNQYPPTEGIPSLKEEAAIFIKKFLGIDVTPECCVPTCGAMHGGFLSQAVVGYIHPKKRVILFLDPGFPVNKMQNRFLGLECDSIDFYSKRGEALVKAVETRFQKGDVAGFLYSNPNNPTWITHTEQELRGFGRVLTQHDGIAIEDLAYFGMDFKEGYEKPGVPPYPPTIARYTENYILLLSSSKIFSYAGQRIGVAVLSPKLFHWKSDALEKRFGFKSVAHSLIHSGIYCTTSGVSHAPQWGLKALLEKANQGNWNFLGELKEYQRRARFMKKIFQENGFRLAYDEIGKPLNDGFYFTYNYPGINNTDLAMEQLYYGWSSLSLIETGAKETGGFRACVSLVDESQFDTLRYRLRRFHEDHG